MLENNQRIKTLLEQYVNKTITAADFAELFDYINKEENKEFLDDYMKQSNKNFLPDAEVHHVDWDHMYNNIIANKKEKNRFTWAINFGQKLTIAAAVMIVAYIGYQSFFHKTTIQPTIAVVKQDISPGGNKAILKLADGSQIILNDVQKGSLAIQGNSNINKSDKDFIAYTANEKSAKQVVYTNVLTTPRGGQYRLMLPDQTLVWLNAESSITFPTAFIENNRKVKITGEVYFEVAKDKNKPFIVENGDAKVEVLGTHFNFNAYPNEEQATVTLLEGSIKLSKNSNSRIISPGQQAAFSTTSDYISLKNVDVDNVVDWKNGLFIFEDASVQEVMRQIERWYDVEVKYNGKIPSIKFNGIISRNNNVSKLIKLLQAAGNIGFDIQNQTITVKQLNK